TIIRHQLCQVILSNRSIQIMCSRVKWDTKYVESTILKNLPTCRHCQIRCSSLLLNVVSPGGDHLSAAFWKYFGPVHTIRIKSYCPGCGRVILVYFRTSRYRIKTSQKSDSQHKIAYSFHGQHVYIHTNLLL